MSFASGKAFIGKPSQCSKAIVRVDNSLDFERSSEEKMITSNSWLRVFREHSPGVPFHFFGLHGSKCAAQTINEAFQQE